MVHGEQSVEESEQKSNYFDIASKVRLVRLIVVQSSVGQKMFSFADNILWTVEKCAEWSLSSQEIVGEDRKSSPQPEYVRPLPWYLFLPTLVLIRTIRMSLNGIASIMGYPEITPHKMVSIMQRGRRRIHAIMMNGSKNRQDSKDKRLSMHEARKALIRSIRLTLSTLSCLDASKPSLSPPPTRIHVNNAFGFDASLSSPSQSSTLKASTPESLESRKSSESPESTTSTLKDTLQYASHPSESEEPTNKLESKESLNQMIDRLADESSDDDEDFEPDCKISSSQDDNDSTSNNTSSNVSMNELTSIIEEANEIYNNKYNEPDANQSIKQDIKKENKQISEDSFENISESEIKQTKEEIEQLEQSSEKAIEQVKQTSEKTTEDVEQTSEKATEEVEQTSEKATEDVKQTSEKVTEEVEQTSEKATEEIEQTSEEATKQEPEEDFEQRPSSEENAKVDDHLTSSRSHDSLVCCASDPSSLESDVTFYSPISSDNDTSKEQSSTVTADKIAKTNQFINGEVRFVSETMISESKSCERTNNGAVVEKRNTNVSKIHRGKRTSHGNRKKK